MKTEQEQIKAIKQIIDERVETTLGQVQGRHGNVIKTVDTIIIARDIIEAGYGDVSEYKAEIKKLKNNIIEQKKSTQVAQDNILSLAQQNQEYREQQVKQAKIDVLNELRERITKDRVANDTVVINANYEIKELIKEIKNGKCNC